MKYFILALLLIGITGCGTSINVSKRAYADGKMVSYIEATYWSSKDVVAPSLSIDKNATGYNLEMKAADSNNSKPMEQVNKGLEIVLDGLTKFK